MLPDGSIDLAAMLSACPPRPRGGTTSSRASSKRSEKAWRVNVASLDFRAVTAVTLASMLGLSPLSSRPSSPVARLAPPRTDALEFALVTLLIVMFSPLSFNYAYVWLIYPLTVALHLVLTTRPRAAGGSSSSPGSPRSSSSPPWPSSPPSTPRPTATCFVPALLLVFGLGLKLAAVRGPAEADARAVPSRTPRSHAVASPAARP